MSKQKLTRRNRIANVRPSERERERERKERTSRIVDFAVPVDHKIKLKESKKKYNYRDLAREMKKQR